MKLMEKVYAHDTELLEPVKERCLYERDFYGWAQEQYDILKAGRFDKIDMKNLLEEVESMGKSQRSALGSYLEVYFEHILKLGITDGVMLLHNRNGWEKSAVNGIGHAQDILEDNPSLSSVFRETARRAFKWGARSVKIEYRQYAKAIPMELPKALDTSDFLMLEDALDVDSVIKHFGFSSIESRIAKE